MLRPLKNYYDLQAFPDLLAGLAAPDDAAIWKLDESRALVLTTDFFTPIVDDPYDYGQIAAANSLSDIYAMGGKPFLALNILALPPQLPPEIGAEILHGGADKALEAGVVIAGGHTIQDKEPKYGLVALGFVSPDHILTKQGLKQDDALFISKPIGSGVISSALKGGLISAEDASEVIGWLKKLNDKAALLAQAHGARSATDITGFSFLGHAWEMAEASRVGLRFFVESVPLYEGVEALAPTWCFSGGSYDNAEFYGKQVRFAPHISQETQMVLFDPQTSGGLLFAVPGKRVNQLEQAAAEQDIPLWRIGEVTETGLIEVV